MLRKKIEYIISVMLVQVALDTTTVSRTSPHPLDDKNQLTSGGDFTAGYIINLSNWEIPLIRSLANAIKEGGRKMSLYRLGRKVGGI